MIRGYFYSKGSAARVAAVLSSNGMGRYAIELEDGRVYRGELSHLNVSERLGNVERKLRLEDGTLFTSLDNDAIDVLFKGKQTGNALVHYLETHLRWIAVAVVVAIFTAFSFFKWGIPWTSQKIAHALPYETNELIAKGSMDFLDNYMFDESNLSQAQQEKISKHFYNNIAPLSIDDEKKIVYKLHFRAWTMGEEKIPNALALPSGDIILTDKFIELAKTQDEIDSVLLHEMGHVVHRHGLEMMIEGTFVTVAVMMMTGDASGMGDFGIGLGTALVSSAYSRGHESEADRYSFEKMLEAKIDPRSFSNIMQRMTQYMQEDSNSSSESKGEEFLEYFASHPSTKERIDIANRYAACFEQGLSVCK
ncbi:MAG TPA: M48 family metallopeptidase [Bacteroidetes bacterium]|nr:M48 family metallopeptidase [Bacteroidota bacterium]